MTNEEPEEPSAERREEIIGQMHSLFSSYDSWFAGKGLESIYDVIIAPLLPVQEAKTVLPDKSYLPKVLREDAVTLKLINIKMAWHAENAADLIEAQQKQIDARKQDIDKWKGDYLTLQDSDFALSLRVEAAETMAKALEGVIRIADRKTVEFDAAREALAAFRKPGETG